MKVDSCVYLDGPMIDYAASAPVCVTALLGIYPFIMTARFGIESDKMGHNDGYHVCCPDKIVEFVVSSCIDTDLNPDACLEIGKQGSTLCQAR